MHVLYGSVDEERKGCQWSRGGSWSLSFGVTGKILCEASRISSEGKKNDGRESLMVCTDEWE